ncbi:hypothetical protein J2S46_000509 [Kitasatospora herbaricolor]|uniref:hypothetical protein n=1 Tax=Kitasatospora herbaricolor TaxID=68217 RepID=UPI0017497E77|nr:hypothetical protein [Kitasatospora herbaricolor]MDQ0305953.1 hypothetical protein [Kitasatospora herbaricolor]
MSAALGRICLPDLRCRRPRLVTRPYCGPGLSGIREAAAVLTGGIEGVAQGGKVRDGCLLGETCQQPAQDPLVPVSHGFGDGRSQ